LERAEMHGKPVFLILARGDERNAIPFGYEETQRIDIRTDGHYEPGMARLIGAVQKRLVIEVEAQVRAHNVSLITGDELSPPEYEDEVVIRPIDARFAKGSYTGLPEYLSFQGTWGWTVFYKRTVAQRSAVWAQWTPALPKNGRYEVSAF